MDFKIHLCCYAYVGEAIGWLLLIALFFSLSTVCFLKAKPALLILEFPMPDLEAGT